MIRAKCPICKKAYEIAALSDLPTFPFCSERCRLLDLGRWIDGAYAIPGPQVPDSPASEAEEDDGP